MNKIFEKVGVFGVLVVLAIVATSIVTHKGKVRKSTDCVSISEDGFAVTVYNDQTAQAINIHLQPFATANLEALNAFDRRLGDLCFSLRKEGFRKLDLNISAVKLAGGRLPKFNSILWVFVYPDNLALDSGLYEVDIEIEKGGITNPTQGSKAYSSDTVVGAIKKLIGTYVNFRKA